MKFRIDFNNYFDGKDRYLKQFSDVWYDDCGSRFCIVEINNMNELKELLDKINYITTLDNSLIISFNPNHIYIDDDV